MSTIKVAIAGVGNCASSLVQGTRYYRDADPTESVPGLMHVVLGGYHVRDVQFVAAFDVDAAKVGLDLGKAIFAGHNNTIRFAPVGDVGVTVQRGPTLDGLGTYYRQTIEESPLEAVDVAAALRESRADVRCDSHHRAMVGIAAAPDGTDAEYLTVWNAVGTPDGV